jgi:hypothetical protein
MRWVSVIDWRINPFRAEQWAATWGPTAAKASAFGATEWALTRNTEDPLHFRQTAVWDRKEDFDRYWYDPEVQGVREQVVNWYHKPLNPVWFQHVAGPVEAER